MTLWNRMMTVDTEFGDCDNRRTKTAYVWLFVREERRWQSTRRMLQQMKLRSDKVTAIVTDTNYVEMPRLLWVSDLGEWRRYGSYIIWMRQGVFSCCHWRIFEQFHKRLSDIFSGSPSLWTLLTMNEILIVHLFRGIAKISTLTLTLSFSFQFLTLKANDLTLNPRLCLLYIVRPFAIYIVAPRYSGPPR